jgi:hypothetical protein
MLSNRTLVKDLSRDLHVTFLETVGRGNYVM